MNQLRLASFVIACTALSWLTPHSQAQFPGSPAAGPQPAGNSQPPGALTPNWLPLSPEHEKYLTDILAFWEFTTSKIERYQCQFKRWEYEPELKTFSEGVIKYAAPDKGMFKVEQIQHLVAPTEAGGQPQWVPQQDGFREHWVCDGKSIFEFDYNNKQLKQRTLPPQMQGQRITDGPLPFLFGAKVEQIRARFWLHVITPETSKGEFWLEAVPKTREDAANFRTLHIILSEDDFLPKAMVLFHRNNTRTTFAFEQRETNWSVLPEMLRVFHREFFEPKAPAGWQKVVEPIAVQPPPQGPDRQVQRGPAPLPRR